MIRCEAGKVDYGVSDKDIETLKGTSILYDFYAYYMDNDKDIDEFRGKIQNTILSADLLVIYRALIDGFGKEDGLEIISDSVKIIQSRIEKGEI